MTQSRVVEPFYGLGEHFAIDLPGARAVFTTRRGGVSRGPYESLNLGRLTDDDPEAVARNRQIVQAELRAPVAFVRQIHGTTVVALTSARGEDVAPDELIPADGQVTARAGQALAVLTADCLPVAIAAPGAVAMLHAGWRGLAGGIIAAGVRALRDLGASGPLAAAIGPGAGPCCYEVGPEIHRTFAVAPARVHRGANLDLKAIAVHELGRAGVKSVVDIGVCTICSDPSLLFSHRRDHGVTGRQAGMAWLT
ncbi:MAG: polyphenol oxidase family protein [Actinomycetota bacterium]|nr:polyphenol oxidase family protein [Actinomycetota bacterium]